MKIRYGDNVFDESVHRLVNLYEEGHRIVVSFSAGKDSGVCLELCLLAAEKTGRLPVEVVMRDEEVMFPGTFEYAERTAKRKNVHFHWLVANQPVINVFNRECPYFWVFDPLLKPEEWVRQPPDFAEHIPDKNIVHMADTKRFPPDPGKYLIHIIGLRTQESRRRQWAIASAKGYLTKPFNGERNCNPIYDWLDGDVWKAHKDNEWDFNTAYSIMNRLGVPRRNLRIAPPTLSIASVDTLKAASKAWPQWFEKVCQRLPGIRAAARYGKKVVQPQRKLNETWEQCFHRTCIDEAPQWIRERSLLIKERLLSAHRHHSVAPFPQVKRCPVCSNPGSWRQLARIMYMGDPFCLRGHNASFLPYMEPEYFRKGAGTWDGKPTW